MCRYSWISRWLRAFRFNFYPVQWAHNHIEYISNANESIKTIKNWTPMCITTPYTNLDHLINESLLLFQLFFHFSFFRVFSFRFFFLIDSIVNKCYYFIFNAAHCRTHAVRHSVFQISLQFWCNIRTGKKRTIIISNVLCLISSLLHSMKVVTLLASLE